MHMPQISVVIFFKSSVIACQQDKNLVFIKESIILLTMEEREKTPLFKSISVSQIPIEGKYTEPRFV